MEVSHQIYSGTQSVNQMEIQSETHPGSYSMDTADCKSKGSLSENQSGLYSVSPFRSQSAHLNIGI